MKKETQRDPEYIKQRVIRLGLTEYVKEQRMEQQTMAKKLGLSEKQMDEIIRRPSLISNMNYYRDLIEGALSEIEVRADNEMIESTCKVLRDARERLSTLVKDMEE